MAVFGRQSLLTQPHWNWIPPILDRAELGHTALFSPHSPHNLICSSGRPQQSGLREHHKQMGGSHTGFSATHFMSHPHQHNFIIMTYSGQIGNGWGETQRCTSDAALCRCVGAWMGFGRWDLVGFVAKHTGFHIESQCFTTHDYNIPHTLPHPTPITPSPMHVVWV